MSQGADIAFPHLGITIGHLPKGITIGGFTIAFYGIIIACGMLAGLMLARWQAKRTGQSGYLLRLCDLGNYFAIIGARLYYVAFSWDAYKNNLLQIFNTRGGGLAIYGGVIAAVLTAIVYCKKKKYSFFLFADTAVPGLVLGQIIGRFGNFMNREAFGEYTDSLFAMRLKVSDVTSANITSTMREHISIQDGIRYIQVHPTFLYEAAWNVLVLTAMLLYTKKKKFDGEIFLIYLIGYGLGRAWVEGLRTDQLQIGTTGIAVSQVFSAVLVVAGVVVWIYRMRRLKKKEK